MGTSRWGGRRILGIQGLPQVCRLFYLLRSSKSTSDHERLGTCENLKSLSRARRILGLTQLNMALTVQLKVRRNDNVTRPEHDRLTVVAAVGFHDNYSAITQRFMEACTRVGIPSLADFNTPRGTVGVAKVSGLVGPFFILI